MLTLIKQRIDSLIGKADFFFGIIFALVVFLNFISAAMRYSGMPVWIGADEIQVYSMIWLIFLGAAIVAWRHHNLRMDVLVDKLGPKFTWYRALIESLLMLVVCGSMVWISSGFVMQIMQMGQHSDGAGIPMWIPHTALLLGFGLMTLGALFRLIELLSTPSMNNDSEHH